MNQVEPGKLQPALIGGIALGVASAIPKLGYVNCACCALVIGGGFLAAYLYLRNAPSTPEAPYGAGAVLGLLTGAIGAVVTKILSRIFEWLFPSSQLDLAQLEEELSRSEVPPEVQDKILDFISTIISGGFVIVLISFLILLIVFTIFALIGSLIGVAVLHKKPAPTPSSPVP